MGVEVLRSVRPTPLEFSLLFLATSVRRFWIRDTNCIVRSNGKFRGIEASAGARGASSDRTDRRYVAPLHKCTSKYAFKAAPVGRDKAQSNRTV